MGKSFNLKALFTADTTSLKQASKQAANSIKVFEQEATGALSSLAESMGINLDRLVKISQVGEGAGRALAKTFNESNVKAQQLAQTIGLVGGNVAALAVGVAVASWKQLNEQADYFYKNSVEGAIRLAGIESYAQTLKNTIIELNNPKESADALEEMKKRYLGTFSYLSFIWKRTFKDILSGNQPNVAMSVVAAQYAVPLAQRNAFLAQLAAEQLKEAELELARIRAQDLAILKEQYEAERLLAKDADLSAQERLDHQRQAKAILLEMQKLEGDAILKVEELTGKLNSYTMTSYQAQIEEYAVEKQRRERNAQYISQQKELLDGEKNIVKEIQKGNEELAKRVGLEASAVVSAQLEAITQEELMPIDFDSLTTQATSFYEQLQSQIEAFKASISLDLLDVEAAKAIDAAKAVAKQINDSFKGIITNAITGISSLVGEAIAGTNDFTTGLFKLLGDLLVELGKVAVAAGVGMLEIKKAFESLNPWVAIAAGAALIALGSAISNSVSALGSQIGGGGGVAYAGTTASSSWNLNAEPRSERVEVSGSFVVHGEDLVAVISRNNNRKKYTR